MRLADVLGDIRHEGAIDSDLEITSIVSDSRKVQAGCLFVCIAGRKFDSHDVALDMQAQGALAVVTQRRLGLPNEITVHDTRHANAVLCQNFFDNPQKKLKLIGVTGTNGKTTTASIVKQALTGLGFRVGLISTICCEIADLVIPAKFTTPEPWDLCALFHRMVGAGCTHAVMEASSQALAQGRLIGLQFECSVFTNLTQDHLDYHGTMEDYYQAKKLLFLQSRTSVLNLDDPYGQRLCGELAGGMITLSAHSDAAHYTAKCIEYSISGVRFALNGHAFIDRVFFPMPGGYSVHNALGALCALFAIGIDRHDACVAVSSTRGVKGRCEVLHRGEITVISDFAHTGDGLEQLLKSLRPFVTGRLVTLFGCAGDRDPSKRPAMAQAVCRYSDHVVLSSDNPRTEDAVSIIEEVGSCISETGVPFTAIPDRFHAIRWAVENSRADDVLVLCGKGHEDYQVLDGYTVYLDERRIIEDLLREQKNTTQQGS